MATLYGQRPVLIAGNAALSIVAVAGWFETGQSWFLGWSAAIVVNFILRTLLEQPFYSPKRDRTPPALWRRIHRIGAWTTGVLLGCAALVIVTGVNPLVQLLVLSTSMVFIMGGAARNAASKLTATGQIVFGIGPVFAACEWTRDVHYVLLSLAMLFELFAGFALVKYLHERLVRLLTLNEENAALAAAVQRANAALVDANRLLEQAAMTDALTGIANRRRFDDALGAETRRAQRDRSELSLLLLDVDSFKRFNDHYGHQAGDACLRQVAAVFAASMRRGGEVVARYGGEEFAAVLPRVEAADAVDLAEIVRQKIAALGIPHALGSAGVVTVSIGVATFAPQHGQRPEDLVRAADEALYTAKATGRNRVRLAPATGGTAGAAADAALEGALFSRPNERQRYE